MNIGLFKVCYEDDHFEKNDSNIQIIDNRNDRLAEAKFGKYPHIIKIYEENKDKYDAWGIFDFNWEQKTGLTSDQVLKTIEENIELKILFGEKENTIYYNFWNFNHAHVSSALTLNPWHQAFMCYPEILDISDYVMEKINIEKTYRFDPIPKSIYSLSHHFVAKKEFWDEYIIFIKKVYDILTDKELPYQISEKLNSSTDYKSDNNLNLFSLIIERLPSTFINLNLTRFMCYCDNYDYKNDFKYKNIVHYNDAPIFEYNKRNVYYNDMMKLAAAMETIKELGIYFTDREILKTYLDLSNLFHKKIGNIVSIDIDRLN